MGLSIRRKDFRLGGKELYIYYSRVAGERDKRIMVRGCTNKRVLSEKSGIKYDTLVSAFTRRGSRIYDNGDMIIMKLYVSDIEKGRQSMSRRGVGGMEKFSKFIRRGESY